MTLYQHTFDNGTQDSIITISAGPGVNGDGFNNEGFNTGSNIKYDNSHTAPGAMACKVTLGGTTPWYMYVGWDLANVSALSARGLFYFTSYPPSGSSICLMTAWNSGYPSNSGASVWLNDSGHLYLTKADGTTVGTFGSVLPLNTWVRVEAQVTLPAGINVQRYDDLLSDVANDSLSVPGANTAGGGSILNKVAFGAPSSTGNPAGFVFWMDEVAVQDAAIAIGPPSASKMANYTPTDVQYDYAVAGVPLFSAASAQNPFGRKTAPYRKDQIDQSTDPGEQSLVYWWLRSQSSFHGGAGIEYEEPDPNVQILQYRFKRSSGLDMLGVKGKAPMAPDSSWIGVGTVATTKKPVLMGAVDSTGADCLFTNSGTGSSVKLYTGSIPGSPATVTWGGANTPVSACNDGTNYYIADSVGIYKGTLTGGAGALAWNTGSANTTIAWLKQRLVAGIANKIYELTGVAGAPGLPADGATGHIYSHPNTNWKWTDFAEGPSAMYVAGYAGAKSGLFKMTVGVGDGSVPTVGDPVVIYEPPDGELINALCTVSGKYLAIGSTKGVRIAIIDDAGNLEVGPLHHAVGEEFSCLSLATRGRFVYFTWTGMDANSPLNTLYNAGAGAYDASGIGVIDLGQATDNVNPYIISPSRYAYSSYLEAHNGSDIAGTAWAVTTYGASGQLMFSVGNKGDVYWEHPTQKYPTSFLQTGKIRFHTLEPKLFKSLKLRFNAPVLGNVDVFATTPDGTNYLVGSWASPNASELEANFPIIQGVEWLYLTIVLIQVAGNCPTLTGYTIRALPAQKNQRNLFLSVYIFDYEEDRTGNSVGGEGTAAERLGRLEAYEEARDSVSFQDFTVNGIEDSTGRLVVIDDITFTQTDPPERFGGLGGIAQLTLRTVT